MHFHDNPTAAYHLCRHTSVVSLGSTTSQSQRLRGVRLAFRPTYFAPQVMSFFCTTRTTPTCPFPTRCEVQPQVLRQKMSPRLSQQKAYIWILGLVAVRSDILDSNEGCQQTKFPSFLRGKQEWRGKSANIIVVKVLKHSTPINDSLVRPLQVIDGKRKDFYKPRQQELPRRHFPQWTLVFTDLQTTSQRSSTKDNEFICTESQLNRHKHSKRNAKS